MKNKAQHELVNTGLGLACTGLGGLFALFPGFMNRAGGFNVEKGPGGTALLRLLGMRDVAFGLGLLLNRTDRKKVSLWLNLLALIAGSDILVLGLALPRSKSKFSILLGIITSLTVVIFALANNRQE
ncbi:MAG: hypothetical protein WCS37_09135 [Chloroflexota bacterium]|nr:hypothetical protein [Chloroflexota bacterium]